MARTRSSLKRKAEAEADAPQDTATSPQTKLPVRGKDEESLPSQSPAKAVQGTGSLTVFDDDDDVGDVAIIPTTNSAGLMEALTGKGSLLAPGEEEEEEESDDDAAPEAVSTSQAASSIKKSTQAAQKAAQE